MASEVDICNVALGHLGDSANIQSISPPDGSAQAEHCQRFYPIARDALLEMHTWSFATRRAALAQLSTNPSSTWLYAYAQPTDIINGIAILDPAASDDLSVGIPASNQWTETPTTNGGVYTPQPYQLETAADGTEIVLTNQVNAVMRYTFRCTDTAKFSPLFTKTLCRSLAALLAGPIIKGEAGDAAGARQETLAFGRDGKSGLFGTAAGSDAGDRRTTIRDRHNVAWIAGR